MGRKTLSQPVFGITINVTPEKIYYIFSFLFHFTAQCSFTSKHIAGEDCSVVFLLVIYWQKTLSGASLEMS